MHLISQSLATVHFPQVLTCFFSSESSQVKTFSLNNKQGWGTLQNHPVVFSSYPGRSGKPLLLQSLKQLRLLRLLDILNSKTSQKCRKKLHENTKKCEFSTQLCTTQALGASLGVHNLRMAAITVTVLTFPHQSTSADMGYSLLKINKNHILSFLLEIPNYL